MRAVVYDRYAPSADVLRLVDLPDPEPGPGELLVRVVAVSLNASDWEFLTAKPAYVRALGGLTTPRRRVLGSDIAGVVERVGAGVRDFAPGDEVFGDVLGTFGGLAERAVVRAAQMRHKPEALSFEAAATLPQAACVAWQGLREGGIREGADVLINGAGGGSGTFAIQLAKRAGAAVTGVDRSEKHDDMRALGCDHVIDFRREDFTRSAKRYDLILNFVTTHPPRAYRPVLNPGGCHVMVGGSVPRVLQTLAFGPLLSLGSRRIMLLLGKQNERLEELASMVIDGELVPVIEATYPLTRAADAMQHLGDGRARGNLVVTID